MLSRRTGSRSKAGLSNNNRETQSSTLAALDTDFEVQQQNREIKQGKRYGWLVPFFRNSTHSQSRRKAPVFTKTIMTQSRSQSSAPNSSSKVTYQPVVKPKSPNKTVPPKSLHRKPLNYFRFSIESARIARDRRVAKAAATVKKPCPSDKPLRNHTS